MARDSQIAEKETKIPIIKKKKGIKRTFFTVLRYEAEDSPNFKQDLLLSFLDNLNKHKFKAAIFVIANIFNDKKLNNSLFIIIWKDVIIKRYNNIKNEFNLILSELNLIFNFKLIPLDKQEINNLLYNLYFLYEK